MFDLSCDPHELKNCSGLPAYRKQLETMRGEMIAHLSERGEGFVKDGKLVVRENTLLYSPNYPSENK